MTVWVLLKQSETGGYALYQDGKLVSNFSRHDYKDYIDDQIAMRHKRDGEGELELIERPHAGDFPETLENKGMGQKRLKSRGHKTQKEIDADSDQGQG